jgi:hypothetical protein
MDTCQTVIGHDVAFRHILDEILMDGSFLSLGKLEGPLMIKGKS